MAGPKVSFIQRFHCRPWSGGVSCHLLKLNVVTQILNKATMDTSFQKTLQVS